MYLTDIRGFSSDENISVFPARFSGFSPKSEPLALWLSNGGTLFRAQRQECPKPDSLCRITIHGMGMLGSKGITTHFARFCCLYNISPLYISLSDMGIAFFVPTEERERIFDALEAYFPMWT